MNSVSEINWDSKLTPILIILFEISGLILEGEIKIRSLYFFYFIKFFKSCRPNNYFDFRWSHIIYCWIELVFIFIARVSRNYNYIFVIYFLEVSCKEYRSEYPISLYGPERGANKPTLSILLFSLLNTLELNKNII